MRGEPAAHVHLRTRLRTLGKEGAKRLMLANQRGDFHAGRRIDLTLHVAGVLAPELGHCALFSQDRWERFNSLAAIDAGMTRPLLAAALMLRNNWVGETKLRIAFPQKRKLVNRLANLAGDLPILGKGSGEKHKGRSKRLPAYTSPSLRPEYLAAAKLAIAQLGTTADHGELLKYAESILQYARQRPVDIQ